MSAPAGQADHFDPFAPSDPPGPSEATTQFLDPSRMHEDGRADLLPGADSNTQLLDMSQFRHEHAHADNDTQFLDVSQFGTVAPTGGDSYYDYDDDPRFDDPDAYADEPGFDPDDGPYLDDEYDGSDGYDDADYDDPADYDDDPADPSSSGFAFSATDRDEPRPVKRSRSVAVPVVLGVLGVALLAGLAVIGWQVFGATPESSSHAAGPGAPALTAQQPIPTHAAPTNGTGPTTTTKSSTTTSASTTPTTTTSGAPAALPVGASPCSQQSGSQGAQGQTATGSSVTSCGFADAVREAYEQSAGSDDASSVAGNGPSTSIVAVSPVTGESYPMTCTGSDEVVTCTGGNNAVVYVY